MFVRVYDYVSNTIIILNIKSIVYFEGYEDDIEKIECLKIYTNGVQETFSGIIPMFFILKKKEDIKCIISATSNMQ